MKFLLLNLTSERVYSALCYRLNVVSCTWPKPAISMKNILFVSVGAFLASFMLSASAELSLRINGDFVAAPGDLELVRFWPSQRTLEIRTFFNDVRCEVPDTLPAEATSLRLDQLNDSPLLEPEAVYAIPNSGSIIYSPDSGEIEITTTGITQTANSDCSHQFSAVGTIDPNTGLPSKGAVRVNGFENTYELAALPASSGLGVDLKLSNISALFAGRFVAIPLDLMLSTSLDPTPDPTFSPSTQVVDDTWTVPLLWPGESASLEVRYSNLESGDSISITVSDPISGENVITAQNRNPDAPTDPYFLPAEVITVINTSTTVVVR